MKELTTEQIKDRAMGLVYFWVKVKDKKLVASYSRRIGNMNAIVSIRQRNNKSN